MKKEMKEALQRDFKSLIEKLTPKYLQHYNPTSFHDAASIASILLLAKELEEDVEEQNDALKDDIKDELMGAEHYYTKWIESGDENYKMMARDELRHADFAIKKALAAATDQLERVKISSMTAWYDKLFLKLRD